MWASAPEPRDQAVLFPVRLDDAISADHTVRQFDALLHGLNWQSFEVVYHGKAGQPAIHPRVMASVILWGLLQRIRASRRLEEAIQCRLDFRWLVEGRSIDHATLCSFRIKFKKQIEDVFVQLCLQAKTLGYLNLTALGFDGTRVRSNNRRSGTRSVANLKKEVEELRAKCQQFFRQADGADTSDEEVFAGAATHAATQELSPTSEEAKAMLAELKKKSFLLTKVEGKVVDGEAAPKRIPVTDPDSRMMPNKDGGHSPNYTPITLVDVDSGLIVGAHVLKVLNEHEAMLPMVDDANQTYGLPGNASLLSDGLNVTGANLAACEQRGITFYGPTATAKVNPALRPDPTKPVPEQDWDKLPMQKLGRVSLQLAKETFIYDEASDVYYCPMGQRLEFHQQTHEAKRKRERSLYRSSAQSCASCPLQSKCHSSAAKRGTRTISREKHEGAHQRLILRMGTAEGQSMYSRRRHPVERPYAVIKQEFGVRQFLLRGIEKVKTEWHWACLAFNVGRLIRRIHSRADPPSVGPPGPPVR